MPAATGRQALIARTRLGESLTRHIAADFAAHGSEVIARLRKEKPVDYFKLVSAILEQEDAAEAARAATYNVIERRIIRPDNTDGGPTTWRAEPVAG